MQCQTESDKSEPKHGDTVECSRCGGRATFKLLDIGIYRPGKPLKTIHCKACDAAQEKARADRRAEKHAEYLDKAKIAAGIEGPLQQRTLEGFKAKGAAQTAAKTAATNFSKSEGAIWLAFCGPTGTGKSHLATAIANCAIEGGEKSVCYAKMISMMRRFRATFHRDCRETEESVARYYRKVKLLILDEFGIRKELSEWERMTLDDILDYRWEQQKRTLIISNMTAKEMITAAGERIASRFAELGAVVNFTWSDYRKGKH